MLLMQIWKGIILEKKNKLGFKSIKERLLNNIREAYKEKVVLKSVRKDI